MKILVSLIVAGFLCSGIAAALPIYVEGTLAPPAAYGLSKLEKALSARNVTLERGALPASGRGVVVGVAAPGSWLAGKLALPEGPEALAVKRIKEGNAEILAVAGRDGVGLMYALLELEEEVAALPPDADWFTSVKEASEKPANSLRRMRILLHHEGNEKDWYHSPEYWNWYLDTLARNRFNGLNLVFSHQSPYLAPMYAWHVKVPEFPNVKGKGLTEEDRMRNLETLRTIARLCKERGIEFTVGIWQHMPWIESFVKTRSGQEVYVEGLPGLSLDEVGRYSYLAMKELLRQVPDIARIQLRPNDESGIPLDGQTHFYGDYVMKAIAEASPTVLIDLRIVGARPGTVEAARKLDRGVRQSQKYFGEFMGLPHTPVDVLTRGYSYGNYLRRPFPNPVYNEVWMLGSHRLFLWGSEDYGRRFGRVATYGGTIGFETDGPQAQKGYQQPYSPAWRIFKHKEDEYYRWEMQRYWAFFHSVGRFGYNPETDHEVWMRPFRARFAEAADTVAAAYEQASEVISLIVASHVNDINMYVWPEKSMGGLLGVYLDLRGGDKAYFPSINDQVAEELSGKLTGRPGPEGLARLYESIAGGIESTLSADAWKALQANKEVASTRADFTLMAHLARYHAHRQRECYRMARFYATGDAGETTTALAEADLAVAQWKEIVALGDRWYYDHMLFGPAENGHWKDSLFLVEAEPTLVRDAVDVLHTYGLFDYGFDFGMPPLALRTTVFRAWQYCAIYDVEPRFIGIDSGSRYSAQRRYGWSNNDGLEWTRNRPIDTSQLGGQRPDPEGGLPRDELYADFVRSGSPFTFRTDLPMAPFRFTFVFSDRSQRPRAHGPFDLAVEARRGANSLKKDITVGAGEVVHYQTDQNVRSAWYAFQEFTLNPSQPGKEAILSGLVISASRPHLGHAPLNRIDPTRDAVLSVAITLPPAPDEKGALSASSAGKLSGADLLWRTDPAAEWTHAPLASQDGFVYTAAVPAANLKSKWLEYCFQATDKYGHTTCLPELGTRHGFFARLSSDLVPPTVQHEAIAKAVPGKSIALRARVSDPDGVAAVRAYFRPLADIEPYECIELLKQGDEYVGTIPGEMIVPEYEFIYYLEAVDEAGNGCFYPDWRTTTPYIIVPVER